MSKYNNNTGYENKLLSTWKANIKRSVKKAAMIHTLTDREFLNAQKQICCKTGRAPNMVGSYGTYRKIDCYPTNSVDRIDSSLGYTIENIQTVCKTYQQAKSDMSDDSITQLVIEMNKFLNLNK